MVALAVAAMAALSKRRHVTILDPWLRVVMIAWACEMTLGTLLNQARFDIGFYVGRTFGLFATFVTMAVLLVEQAKLLAHAVVAHREAKAAAAVRESRDVLALAMRAGRMGAWSRDLANGRVWWSRELEDLFGVPPGSFSGTEQTFRDDFVHPDHRPRIATAVEQAIASGNDYIVEFLVRHGAGGWRWMEGRGRAVYDDSGKPVMLYGFGLDIDDRKRAEAALVESESRFRTLADNMAQLAWMADAAGKLFWLNEQWSAYTGLSTADSIAGGWRTVHHPDHAERVLTELARATRAGEPWEDTFPLRNRDGRFRWFLSRAVPLRDDSGQVYRWFGTATDITAQREAEEALREMDRRKDEFLAIARARAAQPAGADPQRARDPAACRATTPDARARARDMMERQVAHMVAAGRRPARRLAHHPRQDRAAQRERGRRCAARRAARGRDQPPADRRGAAIALDVALPDAAARASTPTRRGSRRSFANLLNNAAQVHAARRAHPRSTRARRRRRRRDRRVATTASASPPEIARPHLRDVRAGRPRARRAPGRARHRADARAAPRRAARRHASRRAARAPARAASSSCGCRSRADAPRRGTGRAAAAPAAAAAGACWSSTTTSTPPISLGGAAAAEGHDVRVAHDGAAALGAATAFRPGRRVPRHRHCPA